MSASTRVVLALMATGMALSPLSTKIAGGVWLLLSVWGVGQFFSRYSVGPIAAESFDWSHVTRIWLFACVLSTALAAFMLGWWHDPWDGINAELRLLFAALGVHLIVSRRAPLPQWLRCRITDAVAVACVAAFGCIFVLTLRDPFPRNLLPANAIVWALAVAFFLGVLAPMVLSQEASLGRRRWWGLAVLAGSAAILLSQSRSSLVIFPWMGWLLVDRWRREHGAWPVARMAGLTAAACVVLAAAWFAPSDPLRMRVASHDLSKVETASNYNTSMGTRLYLWSLACKGIEESPWLGIGKKARLWRIHHAGEELPAAEQPRLSYVRTMGHVHNDYLNAALDGGIPGLASLLVWIGGLLLVARRAARVDPLAARQLRGVVFVVAISGLTNVNFAHNYYAVMLALVVAVILLGAAFRQPPGLQPAMPMS
jgi:O-antigen ligase